MWHSFFGYVMIRMDGLGLERLINRMLQAGIPVWNVRRDGATCMLLEMRAKDFARLRLLRSQSRSRCSLHIIERRGMPFVLARFRSRKALVFGLALGVVLLLVAQTRVWMISVEGLTKVSQEVIFEALENANAHIGMPRKQVQTIELGSAVRNHDEAIAWAGVRLDGVMLHVKVVEAEPVLVPPDESRPAHVVAAKDAIIEKVTALHGNPNVKQSDAVRAGDILITGDITREGAAEQLLVHAKGEVLAKVWYSERIDVPTTRMEWARSGSYESYRALYVAGFEIYSTKPGYEKYELELTGKGAVRGLILPVRQVVGNCHELVEKSVTVMQEEAVAEALCDAELMALDKVPHDARILEKQSECIKREDGCVLVEVRICALEQIGKIREIA